MEKTLNQTTTQNANLVDNTEKSFNTLREMKEQIVQKYKSYEKLMTTHKKSLEDCVSKQNEINTTQEQLNAETDAFNQCDMLLNQYRQFKQDTKRVDQAANQLFNAKFDEFESKWFEWNEKKIVFWFEYKLNWFDKSINNNNTSDEDSKEDERKSDDVLSIDFDKILVNLESQKIHGKFVSVLNKSDLNNLGFKLMKHQLIIYNAIKELIVKYPIPEENDIDDGIEGQVATQMHANGKRMNEKEIDEKYLCPLCKKVMKDPVIASNGITYERSALESYLKQHAKLPDDDLIVDDVDQELDNLFVDDDLKEEIDKLFQ